MARGSVIAPDQLENLAIVLADVRDAGVGTRPELVRRLGLGRNVVSQRVAQLIDFGLLEDSSLAASTGGRPSRELRFRTEAGCLLVAELGLEPDIFADLLESHVLW